MVFDKIAGLIAEQFGVDKDSITEQTSFSDDLNADSLDLVELVMAIEDEFDFEEDEENLANIKTVGDACAFVKERLGE